jgi:hypothetical protein
MKYSAHENFSRDKAVSVGFDRSSGVVMAGGRRSSSKRYSNTFLWISLTCSLLLASILLESVCLVTLYVYDGLRGKDNYWFTREHILTKAFASIPASPVPGKRFIGRLEFGTRAWAQFLIGDGLLGWHLPPNISAYYNEDLIVTDKNGLISEVDDPPIAIEKSISSYRVIVLGGSTVRGQAAPRPALNIVGMLGKGVRQRGLTGPNGKQVEFINGGVDGYTSTQEYLYFVSDLLRFNPDLVIVYDGWNDVDMIKDFGLAPLRTEGERRITERAEQSISIGGSAHLLAANLKYSLTEGDLKVAMIELPWRVFRKITLGSDPGPSIIPFDPRSIEYYRNNHLAFLRLADDKLSIAVFLQPVVGVDDRELSNEEKASQWHRSPRFGDLMRKRRSFYEGTRRVLASLKDRYHDKNHICIADLSHSVQGVTESIYTDTGHLMPKGNEVVAAHILNELVSCGLLQ